MMRDGRGRTPKSHHVRARDTCDIPRKRCICGATESGGPEISNSCEVQEENPTTVEDREGMDLGYPEIRLCNGPGPLPGHHRTNFPGTRGAAEFDPGEKASETRPEEGRGRDLAQEAVETLATDISRHWLGGYPGLESLPGIVGTAMISVSTAEMVVSTAVRMSVLYTWKGPGLWMIAAVWGTAFQMITMPGRWALEWGRAQGEAISKAVEARIGGANLPIDGGGTSSNN
jgi:hypothetical protein